MHKLHIHSCLLTDWCITLCNNWIFIHILWPIRLGAFAYPAVLDLVLPELTCTRFNLMCIPYRLHCSGPLRTILCTIAVTPLPNGDERKLSAQPQPFPRSRMSSIPINSTNSTASTPPYDPRKTLIEEAKKKKKKRKRDDVSDAESGEP